MTTNVQTERADLKWLEVLYVSLHGQSLRYLHALLQCDTSLHDYVWNAACLLLAICGD